MNKEQPYYLDLDAHNENISVKMFEETQICKFLVADFTYQNAGVYYESGYAKGIGKQSFISAVQMSLLTYTLM